MWIWLALTFAFLSSIINLISKIILKKADEYTVAWVSAISAIPVLFFIILKFYGIPKVDAIFWIGVLGSAGLNIFAGIFSFRAIKMTDLSLIFPVSAFNPAFTTVIALITLREFPSRRGALGIILITFGAYLLNLKSLKQGILMPFRKLFTNRGVILFLLANLIWSITPIFEKTAILHTYPQVPSFVSLMGAIFLGLAFFPIMLKNSQQPFEQIKTHLNYIIVMGILGSIATVAAFNAFSLANLGYATAVFKVSIFFSVLWGYLFLKEKGIKERLLGSIVMFIGVLLIVL